jgi:biopolymer transport protein TolQ
MLDALFAPLLAQASPEVSFEGGLVSYFSHSGSAEKVIIFALAISSLIAWTIMFGKHFELRRLRLYNLGFQQRLNEQVSVVDLPENFRVPDRVPYAALFQEAVEAYWRVQARGSQSEDRLIAARLEHAENALQRAVAAQTLRYESNMVFLASIVSSAPFFGLLGTVWGVMEAFGAVALESNATVQALAPGVSGALLSTIAGLLVAIPSLMGYNFLFSRVRQLNTELENYASSLADRIELESR